MITGKIYRNKPIDTDQNFYQSESQPLRKVTVGRWREIVSSYSKQARWWIFKLQVRDFREKEKDGVVQGNISNAMKEDQDNDGELYKGATLRAFRSWSKPYPRKTKLSDYVNRKWFSALISDRKGEGNRRSEKKPTRNEPSTLVVIYSSWKIICGL